MVVEVRYTSGSYEAGGTALVRAPVPNVQERYPTAACLAQGGVGSTQGDTSGHDPIAFRSVPRAPTDAAADTRGSRIIRNGRHMPPTEGTT